MYAAVKLLAYTLQLYSSISCSKPACQVMGCMLPACCVVMVTDVPLPPPPPAMDNEGQDALASTGRHDPALLLPPLPSLPIPPYAPLLSDYYNRSISRFLQRCLF